LPLPKAAVVANLGFQTQAVTLTKEIPAGFVGNVLAGGLISMGVGAATGPARDHKPVIMTLKPSRRQRPA
jgi:hypothetical protein